MLTSSVNIGIGPVGICKRGKAKKKKIREKAIIAKESRLSSRNGFERLNTDENLNHMYIKLCVLRGNVPLRSQPVGIL